MANFKYFADIDGQAFELSSVRHNGFGSNLAKNFSGLTETGVLVRATRMIEYKRNPSKHVCDARCLHAKGRTMQCECSCGGKNHGKGG